MNNKVAVITGGSRGIGKAIAEQLAVDGYDIVVASYNKENAKAAAEELSDKGYNVVYAYGDVSDPNSHKKFIDVAVENFGRLDTYINNAGICYVEDVPSITQEGLENIFSINVFGAVYGIQAAREQFLKQNDGDKIRKIINASSITGYKSGKLLPSYSATKFAIRSFTESAADEFASEKITVNAYCPGIVSTSMLDSIDESVDKISGLGKGNFIQSYTSESIALGRPASPEDVANLVSYLASNKSDYMTGQSIQIDGGTNLVN
ncbi:SDR family NAD(P)-dependent oxidoreductase [Floricoccus penangensis]|uniref:SDR family NAD(P)-dependent oxidoreductase n=1 Tax=Floricoccus penangensis TaxID=1859475 RepID=UPI00203EBF75|nr:SDR family NAD(P)-dependent oxidoreductase [Floricoccus penangensis]URZ86623.1 SDR family oxidoreductase [Floricoccus penangensis]